MRNETNSGDVFAQWRRGVEAASGDLVWIAEADDWADPKFLETAVRGFARGDVVMSYTESNQVDAEGAVTARDYHDYVRDVSATKWTAPYVANGEDEAREALSVKNTIPNVSAVLFRRAPLLETLRDNESEIGAFRVAGDWRAYAALLKRGGIAFSPAPLNFHRRHDASVTISKFTLDDLAEIARMQAFVAHEFSADATAREKADRYLDSLVAHFGLAERYRTEDVAAAKKGVAPRVLHMSAQLRGGAGSAIETASQ